MNTLLLLALFFSVMFIVAKLTGKSKGKASANPAKVANQNFVAQVNGMPQSNGLLSPVFLSNQSNNTH